ncbi:hypothetical protein CLOM_g9264 [Closterium sp. NIES-68]|nr:hypothetical protein CLOM_g9264 [Closterium sp. NIES-68]GJP58822.1 hypothetical protein CLOP_g3932 [Closterium sp. NIES-67]
MQELQPLQAPVLRSRFHLLNINSSNFCNSSNKRNNSFINSTKINSNNSNSNNSFCSSRFLLLDLLA